MKLKIKRENRFYAVSGIGIIVVFINMLARRIIRKEISLTLDNNKNENKKQELKYEQGDSKIYTYLKVAAEI